MLWSLLYSAVRTIEGYLKTRDLKYTIILELDELTELADFWASFLPFGITRWMWIPLCIAVRNFEGCLKRMRLTYNITLLRLNWQITELPSCLLELQDDVKSTLQLSEEFRRLSENNGSQIHYYTFKTELADFLASFLPFGITRWYKARFALQ